MMHESGIETGLPGLKQNAKPATHHLEQSDMLFRMPFVISVSNQILMESNGAYLFNGSYQIV